MTLRKLESICCKPWKVWSQCGAGGMFMIISLCTRLSFTLINVHIHPLKRMHTVLLPTDRHRLNAISAGSSLEPLWRLCSCLSSLWHSVFHYQNYWVFYVPSAKVTPSRTVLTWLHCNCLLQWSLLPCGKGLLFHGYTHTRTWTHTYTRSWLIHFAGAYRPPTAWFI